MIIIEIYLMIEEIQLPIYFFPYHTPFDIINFLHKLYPALMNGSRCIYGSIYEDRKDIIVNKLMELFKCSTFIRQQTVTLVSNVLMLTSNNSNNNNNNSSNINDINNVYICKSENGVHKDNNNIDLRIDNYDIIGNDYNDIGNNDASIISLVTTVNNEMKLINDNSTSNSTSVSLSDTINILKINNIKNNKNSNKDSNNYVLFKSLIIFIVLKIIINNVK
jgi:hypothetical protein